MKNLSNYLSGAKQRYATLKAKGTFLSLLLTTCAAFTACTDEVENISQESRAALQLNVGVNQPTSRAIVEGKTLPNTAQIGVSVVDNTGTAYQNQNYNNVLYTAAEVEGKQTWSTTANVTLSGEEATLYAYYPYATGADIAAIPVDMTETDQKDWMYATPVTGLSDGKSTAEVQLNHALTDLRLTFYKDTYSGKGEVTEFTIQSTGMAVGGTLNAKTGEITLPATPVNTITRTANFTLTDKASATPLDVMLIPTGTEAPVTVSVTVDGHTYSASTTAFTLQKAKAYNYVMKLTSTGLEVTSVALTDWNEETLTDGTFEPEQPEDYSTWVRLVYKGHSNTYTKIMNYSNNQFDISDVDKMAIIEDASSRAAEKPVEINNGYIYYFPSDGEYTVLVKFKDITKIPDYAFNYCSDLISVHIPESVNYIGWSAFGECTELKKIFIPGSVQDFYYDVFDDCSSLKLVTFGEGIGNVDLGIFGDNEKLSTIIFESAPTSIYESNNFNINVLRIKSHGLIIVPDGYESDVLSNVFFNWKIKHKSECVLENDIYYSPDGKTAIHFKDLNADKVSIKQGVETIGAYAFYESNELTEIEIPNSVTNIEEGAFYGCSLWSGNLAIPLNLSNIGDYAFYQCYKLQGDLLFPNSLTNIGEYAFYGCYGFKGTVSFSENMDIINKYAFYQCSGIKNIIIPNSIKTIDDYAFYQCKGLTSLDLGEGVQNIKEKSFYECTSLGELTIPASTVQLWFQTFSGCRKIQTLTFMGDTRLGVQSMSGLNPYLSKIYCYSPSMSQNIASNYVFDGVATSGVLYVPKGCASNYSSWMNTLGEKNWTIQEMTE